MTNRRHGGPPWGVVSIISENSEWENGEVLVVVSEKKKKRLRLSASIQ